MEEYFSALLVILLFGLGICLACLTPFGSKQKPSGSQPDVFSQIMASAPFAIWIEQNGRIVWQNDYCQSHFQHNGKPFLGIQAFSKSGRASKDLNGDLYMLKETCPTAANSYSIFSQQQGNRMVYYGQDATQLTETEEELKRFIQTLTATFAHLPTGLAVFDKKRDLILFNPALSQLLGLAPDWLAQRPNMRSFLDRLRNQGSIPEPKNFNKLRQEFAKLESGAFTGKYEVEWALPSGLVYCVTGRPHPMGGAALLFEDISQAAVLEAEHRAEVQRLYSGFKALSNAVAIFDHTGTLVFANDAFDDLWGCDTSQKTAPFTVNCVSLHFQKHCHPSPIWGELRNFVNEVNEREQWQARVTLKNGQTISMTVSPISGRSVFCEFSLITEAPMSELLLSTSKK